MPIIPSHHAISMWIQASNELLHAVTQNNNNVSRFRECITPNRLITCSVFFYVLIKLKMITQKLKALKRITKNIQKHTLIHTVAYECHLSVFGI